MFLKYSRANTKLKQLMNVEALQRFLRPLNAIRRRVFSLDLLSGHSCPFAKDCLSKVKLIGSPGETKRTIVDGPDTLFRCFSASQEALYSGVYNLRKHNYDLLRQAKTSKEMFRLLNESLPAGVGVMRYHVGGDIFNRHYLDAIIRMADLHPDRLFYAYTKSLGFWVDRIDDINSHDNLVLTASRGGRLDHLIDSENLRESVVVYSKSQALELGLEIDHDDSHAAVPEWRNNSFALLIHGVQPKGSAAGKAVKALKGEGSYGKNRILVK